MRGVLAGVGSIFTAAVVNANFDDKLVLLSCEGTSKDDAVVVNEWRAESLLRVTRSLISTLFAPFLVCGDD